MELKAFETTYKICRRGEITGYYNELEMLIFNSFVEKLQNTEVYDQIIAMREAYDLQTIAFSTITSGTGYIVLDGTKVHQKAIRHFFRYIQIVFSLLGITDAIPADLSADFHIFGSVVRMTKIMPHIPDNSRYLLMSSSFIKELVYSVAYGIDPVSALRKYHYMQEKSVTYEEGTAEFNFHVCAISYLAIRASVTLPCEKDQSNIIGDLRPRSKLFGYAITEFGDGERDASRAGEDAEASSSDRRKSI
nr:28 kDa protein [Aspen mosaic-associated virus]